MKLKADFIISAFGSDLHDQDGETEHIKNNFLVLLQ